MGAVLALGSAQGVDLEFAAFVLPAVEAVIVRQMNKQIDAGLQQRQA